MPSASAAISGAGCERSGVASEAVGAAATSDSEASGAVAVGPAPISPSGGSAASIVVGGPMTIAGSTGAPPENVLQAVNTSASKPTNATAVKRSSAERRKAIPPGRIDLRNPAPQYI